MNVYVNMSWTEARVRAAVNLWDEGLSAAAIAERLGGVSRNAVIGKASRHPDLFEPRRGRTQRASVAKKPSATPEAAKSGAGRTRSFGYQPSAPRARVAEPVLAPAMNIPKRQPGNYRHRDFHLDDSAPVAFAMLGRFQCSWPLTNFEDADTHDMPCCGREKRGGASPDSSYCAEHAAISRGAA